MTYSTIGDMILHNEETWQQVALVMLFLQSNETLTETTVISYSIFLFLFFFFLISFSIIIWKENILSSIIKNSSYKAWSLLCIIKQVQAFLHSQRYDTVLSYIYNTRGDNLKGIIWDLILRFQQRAQRMVWHCSVSLTFYYYDNK